MAQPGELLARAPVRIGVGGGWTDVPPYPVEQGGCVWRIAIAEQGATVTSAAGSVANPASGTGAR